MWTGQIPARSMKRRRQHFASCSGSLGSAGSDSQMSRTCAVTWISRTFSWCCHGNTDGCPVFWALEPLGLRYPADRQVRTDDDASLLFLPPISCRCHSPSFTPTVGLADASWNSLPLNSDTGCSAAGAISALGQNAKNGGCYAMSAWLLIPEVQLAPDTE